MTHSVIHRGYGIEINLSEPYLGHPDRPGLLAEIYGNYRPDRLYCLEAHEYGTTCPGFMTLVKRHGRYHAKHVPDGERAETKDESDLREALRDHTAETAGREGFDVTVNSGSTRGKPGADVTFGGHDGRKLGYEVQLSAITGRSVDRRRESRRGRSDSLVAGQRREFDRHRPGALGTAEYPEVAGRPQPRRTACPGRREAAAHGAL